METNNKFDFIPSMPVHPFDILKDELEAREIKQKDFAIMIGMEPSNLNRMLKSRGDLTSEMAIRLEKALGIPYEHWMGFQREFILDKERVRDRDTEEMKLKGLEIQINERLNLKELYKGMGLILKPLKEKIEAIKPYFGIINDEPSSLQLCGLFKKSECRMTDSRNLKTWVILAIHNSHKATEENEYIKGNAEKAADELAQCARKGIISKEKTETILRKYGIGYFHQPKFEKTPVDAYSIMCKNKPCIVVTYRMAGDRDKFIFDILHELGHITLHMETGLIIGSLRMDGYIPDCQIENDADKFAQDKLITPTEWKEIMKCNATGLDPYKISTLIGKKAQDLDIMPSLAVGRYKHEINKFDIKNYRPQSLN